MDHSNKNTGQPNDERLSSEMDVDPTVNDPTYGAVPATAWRWSPEPGFFGPVQSPPSGTTAGTTRSSPAPQWTPTDRRDFFALDPVSAPPTTSQTAAVSNVPVVPVPEPMDASGTTVPQRWSPPSFGLSYPSKNSSSPSTSSQPKDERLSSNMDVDPTVNESAYRAVPLSTWRWSPEPDFFGQGSLPPSSVQSNRQPMPVPNVLEPLTSAGTIPPQNKSREREFFATVPLPSSVTSAGTGSTPASHRTPTKRPNLFVFGQVPSSLQSNSQPMAVPNVQEHLASSGTTPPQRWSPPSSGFSYPEYRALSPPCTNSQPEGVTVQIPQHLVSQNTTIKISLSPGKDQLPTFPSPPSYQPGTSRPKATLKQKTPPLAGAAAAAADTNKVPPQSPAKPNPKPGSTRGRSQSSENDCVIIESNKKLKPTIVEEGTDDDIMIIEEINNHPEFVFRRPAYAGKNTKTTVVLGTKTVGGSSKSKKRRLNKSQGQKSGWTPSLNQGPISSQFASTAASHTGDTNNATSQTLGGLLRPMPGVGSQTIGASGATTSGTQPSQAISENTSILSGRQDQPHYWLEDGHAYLSQDFCNSHKKLDREKYTVVEGTHFPTTGLEGKQIKPGYTWAEDKQVARNLASDILEIITKRRALYKPGDGPRYPGKPNMSSKWECPICDQLLCDKRALKAHLDVHYETKGFSCSFPGCTETFTTLLGMQRHAETHKPDEERIWYRCSNTNCNTDFSSIGELGSHMRSKKNPCKEQQYKVVHPDGTWYYAGNKLPPVVVEKGEVKEEKQVAPPKNTKDKKKDGDNKKDEKQ